MATTDATYVGLLRGINVGHAKRIAMTDLRAVVEGLGYRDVRTLLNSGNVVFTGAKSKPLRVAEAVESAVASRLGVSAAVIVLSAAELTSAASANPLLERATNWSRLLLAVPADPGDLVRLRPLLKQDWAPEALAIGERCAYAWCPEGLGASPIVKAIDRALADAVTTRNWATVTKLIELTSGKRREPPPPDERRRGDST